MDCCDHCQDTKDLFDDEKAKTELRKYRKNGPPNKCTRLLIEGLKTLDMEGKTLLDVGGGVGMIPCELLEEGIDRSVLVEASLPYLRVAQQEARRRGFGEQTSFKHGDFVDLAPGLPEADLVTLDRVFCCYPHMERLVRASAPKASRWYGVTYPKPRWYGRVIKNWPGSTAGPATWTSGCMCTLGLRKRSGRKGSNRSTRYTQSCGGSSCTSGKKPLPEPDCLENHRILLANAPDCQRSLRIFAFHRLYTSNPTPWSGIPAVESRK